LPLDARFTFFFALSLLGFLLFVAASNALCQLVDIFILKSQSEV